MRIQSALWAVNDLALKWNTLWRTILQNLFILPWDSKIFVWQVKARKQGLFKVIFSLNFFLFPYNKVVMVWETWKCLDLENPGELKFFKLWFHLLEKEFPQALNSFQAFVD